MNFKNVYWGLLTTLAICASRPAELRADAPASAATDATDVAESDVSTFWEKSLYFPSHSQRSAGAGLGPNYGLENVPVQVHAFADLEFVDAQKDGARGGDPYFDQHHANLFVGADIRDNLRAHIEFEFEHAGDEVEIDQAVFTWGVHDMLTIEPGRFYAPFGIERFVWYSPTNRLISRPIAFQQIVPGNFYTTGVMVSGLREFGESLKLSYEYALSNGLDGDVIRDRRNSRQARDNNRNKASTGRVAIVFWPNLEFGASFHAQKYDDNDALRFWLAGGDVSARWQGLEARAEFVKAAAATTGTDLEQLGAYLQLAYVWQRDAEFLPQWGPVLRYDWVDLDQSVDGNNDRHSIGVGLNFVIYEHFRLKGEYQISREDKNAALGETNKEDDSFLTQFAIDF